MGKTKMLMQIAAGNKAEKIMRILTGKKIAKAIGERVEYIITETLPVELSNDIPDTGWMGLCAPKNDGTFTIFLNPQHHNTVDEYALTIGHELCHIIQYIEYGKMNHEDKAFKMFRKVYCKKLQYTKESF